VEDADLDAIEPTTEVARIGRPDAVSVQFRGVCAACQSREATTA
jgi:Fe-S cluster biogenesis protein NfuA